MVVVVAVIGVLIGVGIAVYAEVETRRCFGRAAAENAWRLSLPHDDPRHLTETVCR